MLIPAASLPNVKTLRVLTNVLVTKVSPEMVSSVGILMSALQITVDVIPMLNASIPRVPSR